MIQVAQRNTHHHLSTQLATIPAFISHKLFYHAPSRRNVSIFAVFPNFHKIRVTLLFFFLLIKSERKFVGCQVYTVQACNGNLTTGGDTKSGSIVSGNIVSNWKYASPKEYPYMVSGKDSVQATFSSATLVLLRPYKISTGSDRFRQLYAQNVSMLRIVNQRKLRARRRELRFINLLVSSTQCTVSVRKIISYSIA